MAWNNPLTWTFGETLSAARLNQQIRDNLNFLKQKPVVMNDLGSTNQTGITSGWQKITNGDLQITTTGVSNLEFGLRLFIVDSDANNEMFFDIRDEDSTLYLSDGLSPATDGLFSMFSVYGNVAIGVYFTKLLLDVPAGTHNYAFYVRSEVTGGIIVNDINKGELWVREV